MNSIELFRQTGDRRHLADFYNTSSYQKVYAKPKPKWTAKFDILTRIMPMREGEKVLDVGCAGQMFRPYVEERGAHYSGVDIGAQFEPDYIADAETLEGVPDQNFDWVVMSDILEHVAEPVAALKSARRVGKRVIAVVPNWYRLERFGDRLPRDYSNRHLQRLNPKQWQRSFIEAGWHVTRVRGFFYVPSINFYPFKWLNPIDNLFRTLPFRLLSRLIDLYGAELPIIRELGQELILVGE